MMGWILGEAIRSIEEQEAEAPGWYSGIRGREIAAVKQAMRALKEKLDKNRKPVSRDALLKRILRRGFFPNRGLANADVEDLARSVKAMQAFEYLAA